MINFTTSVAYMKATSVASMSIPGTMTMWVKMPSTLPSSDQYVVFGNYGFYVQFDTGVLECCLYRQNNKRTSWTHGWSANETHFMAFIWETDGSLRRNTIITDGLTRVTDNDNDGTAVGPDLYIGARSDGVAGFEGHLGDLRIYNRRLLNSEIYSIYTSRGADNNYEGLIERWPLAEGAPGVSVTANLARDIITNKPFDTITGTPQYAESLIHFGERQYG